MFVRLEVRIRCRFSDAQTAPKDLNGFSRSAC
jgi:hypothetical protein